MSKIEQLITTLCPNGVEYKRLCELCQILKGTQLNKNKLLDNGYPVINGGSSPSGYWKNYNFPAKSISISQGGASAGFISFQNVPFWAGAHCFVLKQINDITDKYVYYYLKNNQNKISSLKHGAAIPGLNISDLEKLEIPLPPIEIQNEIVRILDSYCELEKELEKELELRNKQYQYYQNLLVDFDNIDNHPLKEMIAKECPNGVEYKTLAEATIWDKKFKGCTQNYKKLNYKKVSAEFLKSLESYTGNVPLYTTGLYNGFTDYERSINFINNDNVITLPDGRANIRLIKGAFVITDHNKLMKPSDGTLSIDFLYHFLKSKNDLIQSFYTGAAPQSCDMTQLFAIRIPIPPLSIQNKIVGILDKFDTLTTSLTSGLPKEIELRNKQYKYYQDSLLDFKRREV